MAVLATQQITQTGLTPAYTTAAAGQEFETGDTVFLHVKNTDVAAHTVTIITPGTAFGLAIADLAVTVPNGSEQMIGPLGSDEFKGADGYGQVTWSATTGMTVAVLEL